MSVNKSSPTSGDVARLANVSQSAVSRAFTPGASVSADTRAKILEAADQLGYRPNALARAMISGRSRLIALLVAYLDNQFYPFIIERMSRKLQEQGYHVLLFMTDPGDQDDVVSQILTYKVEGVILVSATLSSGLARQCEQTGIPVLLFNRYVATAPTSSVTSDNIEGGRLVGEFLAQGGHRRIAFIAGLEDSSTNRDREAGFYKGLAEQGLAPWRRSVGGYNFDGAKAATRELFDGPEKPDAIFVANDHMAFAVMDVLRGELGLSIPKDVSVVGYDDVPEASWSAYNLTTVSQSADEMVEKAVSILLGQIDGGTVSKKAAVTPAKLIVRGSARLPLSENHKGNR